jgi:hypothetical protein
MCAAQQLAVFDSCPAVTMHVLHVMPISIAAKSAGKVSSSNIRIGSNSFVSRVQHCNGNFALY